MTCLVVSASKASDRKMEMEEDDFESKAESTIIWKAHEYVTQSQSSRFCCFRSGIILDTPLTDRATWEKNVKALIPYIFGHEEDHLSEDTPGERNIEMLQGEALRTTAFVDRIAEAADMEGYEFLEPFLGCFNVETFLEKYFALPSKQKKSLKKVIGGEKAFEIILALQKEVERLLEIHERIKRIERSSISIGARLDEFFSKIQKIEEEQIINSFRYFGSEDVFEKEGFIFFNGVSLRLPNLSRITEKNQTKEKAFYLWFRNQISSKITNEEELIAFIIRCLSFNAFAIADTVLRENFSSLFRFELDFPKFQLNSRVGTRYFVNFNEEDETYEVVQIKNYTFRVRPSDATRLDHDIGSINVCWKIKINSRRKIISGELFLRDITFCEDTDLQTRLDILRKMDME